MKNLSARIVFSIVERERVKFNLARVSARESQEIESRKISSTFISHQTLNAKLKLVK